MKPALTVHTESGTCYEFSEGMTHVRRVVEGAARPMRKDGQWVECRKVVLIMGEPMGMWLDGIAERGSTVRTTSRVVDIEAVV